MTLPPSSSSPATKPLVRLRPLTMLVPHVMHHKARIAAAALALVLAAGATLAVPLAVRVMIDTGFAAGDRDSINRAFLLLGGVIVVLAGASALRFYLVTTLGERVVARVRRAVFDHLMSLSPSFYDSAHSGELVSRISADTTQIKAAFGSSASIALRNLLLFAGASAMMIFTSPALSVMVLSVIPVIVIPLVLFGRRVRARSRAAQDTLAAASQLVAESIGAIRVIQAMVAERRLGAVFAGAAESAYEAAREAVALRAVLTGVALFLVFSSVVGVLWVGATEVVGGRMSAGTLGQFVLYAVFAAGALGELSQVAGEVAQAAGAAERIGEILNQKPDIQDPDNARDLPATISGQVAFKDVTFGHGGPADTPVLKGIDFTVAPGETVAVVGPSGAGKSTLFQLLLRFYDPNSGQILIEGVDHTTLRLEALRGAMAYVPQEPVIFAASVLDNIRFGRPDASRDAAVEAARAAAAEEFIDALPQGYEAVLGERGVTLSGGQRQRIAIARALLCDAPILLLDEATSSLDAQSEHLVQQALARLMRGRTTLVIAHRLATIQNADRILVMDAGRIVESGTHTELSARDGIYARLAALQFSAA